MEVKTSKGQDGGKDIQRIRRKKKHPKDKMEVKISKEQDRDKDIQRTRWR
jgi:hypothetical protein